MKYSTLILTLIIALSSATAIAGNSVRKETYVCKYNDLESKVRCIGWFKHKCGESIDSDGNTNIDGHCSFGSTQGQCTC